MKRRGKQTIAVVLAACVAAGGMGMYKQIGSTEPSQPQAAERISDADSELTADGDRAGAGAFQAVAAKKSLPAGQIKKDSGDVYQRLEQTVQSQEGNPEYNGYVLRLKEPADAELVRQLDAAIADGAHLTKLAYAAGTYTAEDLDTVRELIDESAIEYIEPDYQVKMLEGNAGSLLKVKAADAGGAGLLSSTAPNDKYYESYQYNITDLNIPPIWEYGVEGQDFDEGIDMDQNGAADDDDIVVAVIDSGLKDGHEDIDWDRIIDGISFADGTAQDETNDTDGHGTFVTGIIAAQKDNEVGTAGILQKVKVMPIRVFNGESASDSTIVNAINYAAAQKEEFDASGGTAGTNISVINMSLGSSGTSTSMDTACKRAMADGILVVCAAGNDGNTTKSYPAQYAMGVGSTDNTKTVSSYSQRLSEANGTDYANKVWVTAPGEKVTSLYCESTKSYAQMSGTSFSSPEVAALGAVCKSLKNDIDQEEFMQLLKETAVPKTGSAGSVQTGQDVEYGWGLVDFKRTTDQLITDQFGEQTGESRLTVRVQNEAGSVIADPFVSIFELQISESGKEERGAEIAPDEDGTWTLQKGKRYFYAAHAEKYDYQENTFAVLTAERTLTITLQGKSYPVTFDIVNTSGEPVALSALSVRSVSGKAYTAEEDGTYMLRNGTYQFTVEAEGYFDTTESFVIDDIAEDLDNGYVVHMVLRGDRDVCSVKLRVTGDSEDGDITGKSTIVLKNESGDEIDRYKDGAYKLDTGVYSYTVSHDEYKSVKGTITIEAGDIGTGIVQNIQMNGKLYTTTLHIFPLSQEPDVSIYDGNGEVYERQKGSRKVDTRNYRLTDGTYYYVIVSETMGTYKGSFVLTDGNMTTAGLKIAGKSILEKTGTRELSVYMQEKSSGTVFTDYSNVPDLTDLQQEEPAPVTEHVHKYYSEVTKEPTCTETGIRTWSCIAGDDSYTEEIDKLPHQFDENGICTVCRTKESDTIEDEDWLTLRWEDESGSVTERKLALSQLLPYQSQKEYTMISSYYGTSVSYTVYGITFDDLFEHFGGVARCVTSAHIDAMDIPENKDSYGNLYYVDLDRETMEHAMIAWYTINNSSGEERTGSDENNMRIVIDNGSSNDWMFGPDVATFTFGEHAHTQGETVAPTCTEDGYTAYTCSKCGNTYHADITKATGHSFDASKDVITEPTCTSKGYTTHICEICGETVIDSYTAVKHELKEVAGIDATCETAGFETYWKCELCGQMFADADATQQISQPGVIPAGHKLTKTAGKAATCTADGQKAYWKCGRCGKLYADADAAVQISKPTVIKALGHDYSKVSYTWSKDRKTVTAKAICSRNAGHVVTEKASTTLKVTKKATGTKTGAMTYTAVFKNGVFKKQTKKVTIAKVKVGTPAISSAKPAKKKVTVTWKKVSGASAYQVAYRKKGTSKWKVTTVSGMKKTLTGLKAGTKYQIKVAAVKKSTAKTAKVTGKYSKVRTVRTL